MDVIGVKPGMTIGEVGAGRGYFTFKLARRVGDQGKIYANDIDQEALMSIESRCRAEGITNIEIILGKIDDPGFPEGKIDMVFMSFVFHLLEKPVELLRNLKPSMKLGAGFELLRKETFLDRANIYIFRQKETSIEVMLSLKERYIKGD